MALRHNVAISLCEMKAKKPDTMERPAYVAGAWLSVDSRSYCKSQRLHLAERDVYKGLTLVELLVVVVILTTLVAAALPVMAPSSETRRLREAARSLNTMFTSAQTKATELGRPYGVWLQKQSTQSGRVEDRGAVMTVFYCEEPPPFGGYDEKSVVILRGAGPRAPNRFMAAFRRFDPVQPPGGQFAPEPLPPSIFRPDDRLVIQDKEFRIVPTDGTLNAVDENGYLTSTDALLVEYAGTPGPFLYVAFDPARQNVGAGDWTHPQPYLIRRQPQRVDDPLQLPAGIAIDLEASGDRTTFFHDPTRENPVSSDTAVAILFSPGGAIHSVYRNEGGDNAAFGASQLQNDVSHGPIYLMIAKREQVGESLLDPGKTSWLDPESLWISVSPQTGRVVTEVNSVREQFATPAENYAELTVQRLQSREFARSGQGMGGR